jgi:hypothetical protein
VKTPSVTFTASPLRSRRAHASICTVSEVCPSLRIFDEYRAVKGHCRDRNSDDLTCRRDPFATKANPRKYPHAHWQKQASRSCAAPARSPSKTKFSCSCHLNDARRNMLTGFPLLSATANQRAALDHEGCLLFSGRRPALFKPSCRTQRPARTTACNPKLMQAEGWLTSSAKAEFRIIASV